MEPLVSNSSFVENNETSSSKNLWQTSNGYGHNLVWRKKSAPTQDTTAVKVSSSAPNLLNPPLPKEDKEEFEKAEADFKETEEHLSAKKAEKKQEKATIAAPANAAPPKENENACSKFTVIKNLEAKLHSLRNPHRWPLVVILAIAVTVIAFKSVFAALITGAVGAGLLALAEYLRRRAIDRLDADLAFQKAAASTGG